MNRYKPTATRANDLRNAIVAVGAKATVSVQRFALRVIARTEADMALAQAAAAAAGFAGPLGGNLVRSNDCFTAYDFRG